MKMRELQLTPIDNYKRTIFLITFFAICQVGFCEIGDEFDYGGNRYKQISDNSASLIRIDNKLENLVIPSKVYNRWDHNISLSVTMIDLDGTASSAYSKVQTVSIPGTVTVISEGAFARAILESVTFSGESSLKTIGDKAFYRCGSLKEISIPQSVISIGNSAFGDCEKLESITFSGESSLITIGNDAFGCCYSLKEMSIPKSVISIGNEAFQICRSLESISFLGESSLKTIGWQSFKLCESLKEISIPNSVTEIGREAFIRCVNLTKVSSLGSIESINNALFEDCYMLESVNIPETVKSIKDHAFSGCSSLLSVNLPTSLVSIESYAFHNCSSLESPLTIPESVTSFDLSGCGKVKTITLNCHKIPSGGLPLSITEVIINNTVEEIEDNAFLNYPNLATISFEDGSSLKTIGEAAFCNCICLSSITIPNSVISIGSDAFRGCTNLTTASVQVGSSLKSIGDRAFYDCISLKSLYLAKVESIGTLAFYGCSSLRELSIPMSVKTIGKKILGGWSVDLDLLNINCPEIPEECFSKIHVKEINLGENVKKIGKCCFEGCDNLESVSISNSVSTIPEKAFYCCYELMYVYLSNSVKTIESEAFAGCVNLKHVDLGHNIEEIGDYAFAATGLDYVSLPSSITKIGYHVFSYCTELKNINLDNITEICENAFKGCQALREVWLPSIVLIGKGAFSDCTSLQTIELGSMLLKIYPEAFDNTPIKTILCRSITPPFCFAKFNKEVIKKAELFVPYESINLYMEDSSWGNFMISPLMRVTIKHGFAGELNGSSEMEGVTADGLSQLRISQPANSGKSLAGAEIRFEVNGEPCTDSTITGLCTIEGGDAIYTAPKDFPSTFRENSYTVEMLFVKQSVGLTTTVGKSTIKVYRPGVILLHGFLSDENCFKGLYNYLIKSGGYEEYQVLNEDYKSTHTASFKENIKVVEERASHLYNAMLHKKIVSSKYAFVGHSMGGILSRLYAQKKKRGNC